MICAKLLVVVCTTVYTMKLCVAENLLSDFHNDETDEEEKIKEALLLVELLKNEYGRKIRDAVKSKHTSIVSTVENSTCPLTTLSNSGVENTTTSPFVTNVTTTTSSGTLPKVNITKSTTETVPVFSTPQNQLESQNMLPMRRRWSQAIIPQYEYISEPAPNNNLNGVPLDFYRRRNRFYRRKMPDYFYYYDDPNEPHGQKPSMQIYNNQIKPIPLQRNFRRFQNDIDLQSKPQVTGTATVTTPSSTTSITTPNTSNTATVSRKTTAKKQSTNSELSHTGNKKTTHIRKRHKRPEVRAKSDNNTIDNINKNEIKDPIIAEVASEYLRELNGTQTTLRRAKKKRTTLKLFLEGSTQYGLPLPLNHAFCYTNPESSLCRTYI